jgi:hypothetical protein
MTVESEVTDSVNQLLADNASTINSLLRGYASAVQSGDEMLILAAQEQLEKKRSILVLDTLQDPDMSFLSDNIELELRTRISDLAARSNTFEALRTEKSAGATKVDTDQDGISDFDEINQYKTNPNIPDSDNDGVSDGVEIIGGFDPLDAAPQAVITFESPKESVALVREDVLTVTAKPIIEPEADRVRSEISGTALPDSFVTLYVFSSPTVITIKTDADGSFVYTFEKELEDGRHDVYVAITDNTGSIIAQSNPFSFIKEAQAFTPVDAREANTIGSETVIDSADEGYITVVGIAILALGIILLMLGVGLRSRDSEFINTSEDDSDSDNPNENQA